MCDGLTKIKCFELMSGQSTKDVLESYGVNIEKLFVGNDEMRQLAQSFTICYHCSL